MKKTLMTAATTVALLGWAATAAAEVHVVEMLNRGPDGQTMVYAPALVHAQPGDTIRFVSADPGHNAETIDGAIPEGAEGWRTRINQDAEVTVDRPGIYAFKCTPHFGIGMVGLIVVGDSTANLDAVRDARYPGRAGQRMTDLIDQVASD